MQVNPYFRLILPALLLGLSGCSTYEAIVGSDTSTMFSRISDNERQNHGADDASTRLMNIDHALDRNAARNGLVRDLVAESDQACDKTIAAISTQVEAWELRPQKADKLGLLLQDAMAQRQLDIISPELVIDQPAISATPTKALGEAIVAAINKNRAQIRKLLKEREDTDIHRYPVKQALQDVQAYHHACSLQLGVSEVARLSSPRMTPAERQTEIEALMQLRQTLMQQGLSTRSVQQKIDAVILAD